MIKITSHRSKKVKLMAEQAAMRQRVLAYKKKHKEDAAKQRISRKLEAEPPRCELHRDIVMSISKTKKRKFLTVNDFFCPKCSRICSRIARRARADAKLARQLTGGVRWTSSLLNGIVDSTQANRSINKFKRNKSGLGSIHSK